MSPEQALQIINNVTAQVPLVREQQIQVLQAIAALKKLLPPISELPKDSPEEIALTQ